VRAKASDTARFGRIDRSIQDVTSRLDALGRVVSLDQ